MSRLLGIALAALWLVSKAGLWRVVGWNPAESDGLGIGDGLTGRIVDPTTGAGVFNPNLNPAVVGIDPLTGSLAATGTDMSFGSAVIRQVLTGVINGDFLVPPPSGAYSGTGSPRDYDIDSDPTSARYNPLPGALWTPPADGSVIAQVFVNGGRNTLVLSNITAGTTTGGSMMWPVVAPVSTGQQFRALISIYVDLLTAANGTVSYQWFKTDGTTAVGSAVSRSLGVGASEVKIDAGLVPSTAGRLRITVSLGASTGTAYINEVRCVFPPAELPVTLATMAAGTGTITTTETQVIGCTIPANTFVVGATYTVKAWFTMTSTVANVATFRLRCGSTTLTGTVLASMNPTATTTASNGGFYVEATLTIRSVGPGGTAWASIEMVGGTQPFAVPVRVDVGTATVAVNTTQANILELTAQTAAGTTSTTGRMGLIRCEYAA